MPLREQRIPDHVFPLRAALPHHPLVFKPHPSEPPPRESEIRPRIRFHTDRLVAADNVQQTANHAPAHEVAVLPPQRAHIGPGGAPRSVGIEHHPRAGGNLAVYQAGERGSLDVRGVPRDYVVVIGNKRANDELSHRPTETRRYSPAPCGASPQSSESSTALRGPPLRGTYEPYPRCTASTR